LAKRPVRFRFCSSAHPNTLGGKREKIRSAPVIAVTAKCVARTFFDFEFAEKHSANFCAILKI
jgi:hypothetical protein